MIDFTLSLPRACSAATYASIAAIVAMGIFITAHVQAAIIAARELVALPGDPDGINEGVLNVSSF